MKIVAQSFEILSNIRPDLLKWLEMIGRKSHQSEPKGRPEDFMRMLLRRGHESVLEHYSVTALVRTDRGITHEIVRHRIGAYTQESTRYCDYSAGMEFIQPEWGLTAAEEDQWCEATETFYRDLREDDIHPQHARAVLPNCLRSEIVITYNLRSWRHFFAMRCAKAAHPQIREIAKGIRRALRKHIPIIFDADQTREYLDTLAVARRISAISEAKCLSKESAACELLARIALEGA
jgi:thymidylate synthase (FAD)